MKPIKTVTIEQEAFTAQEWERIDYNCPVCGKIVYEEDNFCRKCGEKLEWEKENRENG